MMQQLVMMVQQRPPVAQQSMPQVAQTQAWGG
jgi:hypothetical protein